MDFQKIGISTLIGTVALFLAGFITYGLILGNFFEAHVGSATNLNKAEPDMLIMFIGHIAGGLLLSIIFGRWAGIKTFITGAKAGAIIGLLMAIFSDLIMYSMTNASDLTATLVDPLVMAVNFAIGGGAVGWFLGRE